MDNLQNDNTNTSSIQFVSELLKSNKWPPPDIDDWIKDRPHWLLPENIERIDNTIKTIFENTEGKKCLDVGFGNCLVLLRELKIFPCCSGLYISLKNALEKGVPESILNKGNCYEIPYKSEEFDLVSAWGLLHLLPDFQPFFSEAFRVLKKGGYLYTDGDKSLYIVKLIRKIKMYLFKFLGKKYKDRYELWRDVLNQRDDFHREGIEYIELEKKLKEIGFSKIILKPRFSVKPEYKTNLVYGMLTILLPTFKFKFSYSHIEILAIK